MPDHTTPPRGGRAPEDESLLVAELLRNEYASDLPVSDHGPEDLAAMWGGEVVSTPLTTDEDDFEEGTTLIAKIQAELEDVVRHRATAAGMEPGPVRDGALRLAEEADRRAVSFASRRSLARRPSRPSGGQHRRMPRGDCARHARARRATRSSARSGDSGGDEPGEPPALARGRVVRLDLCPFCDSDALVVGPCLGCSDGYGSVSPCGGDVFACTICWCEIHASLIGPNEDGGWL